MSSKSIPALVFAMFAGLASSALAAPPTITSFTPTSGKLTTTVTITGTGFAAPATVTFNGVAANPVTVNSATSITTLVPLTGTTGKITVTTPGGTVTSTAVFTVIPGIAPSPGFAPLSAADTVSFSGFNAYEAVDFYFDTTDIGLAVTSGTGVGSIGLTIPATATPGTHWISAVGRAGYAAQVAFTVRTDWMELGFRPNHRGRNPFESVLSNVSVSQLEEAWRTPSFGGIESVPADVAGIIYQTFNDGTVRAFNESTGAQVWTYQTGENEDEDYSSPAVINGVVYVGAGAYMDALTASTGALKWSYATGSTVTSAVVKDGMVYFGSFDHNVYALNAATGALVWKYTTGSYVFSSPAVWNGMVFFGSYDDKVYALNAATGAVVWTYTTGGTVLPSPTVVNGTVYVGSSDFSMYAINAENGVLRWSYATGSSVEGAAAVGNGLVYFGSYDKNVYAVNSATGVLTWSFAGPAGSPFAQSACLANGVLFIGDEINTYALDASYGAMYLAVPASGVDGGLIAVNGALLIPDGNSGSLIRYTLNAAAGEAPSAAPDPATLRHHPLR